MPHLLPRQPLLGQCHHYLYPCGDRAGDDTLLAKVAALDDYRCEPLIDVSDDQVNAPRAESLPGGLRLRHGADRDGLVAVEAEPIRQKVAHACLILHNKYGGVRAHYLSSIMGLLRVRPSATAVAQKRRGSGGDPRRAIDTGTS
jgi:hypothetical protein